LSLAAEPRLRAATPADLPALAALRRRSVLAVTGPYTASELAAWAGLALDELRAAAAGGTGAVALAEVAEIPCGFVWAQAGARPHLRGLYVDPCAAGHGIGTRLLAGAQDWVRQQGGRRLYVAASLNAVGFYAARGYARDSPFSLRVAGPAGVVDLAMRKMTRSLA